MERILLVIEGAVQLHQERQGLRALAAAHVLRGRKVARVEPHLARRNVPNHKTSNDRRRNAREGCTYAMAAVEINKNKDV